jgi:hypothetical protein
MKKLTLACIGVLVTMSAFSVPVLAGEKVVKRVPAGAVAFHFVYDLSFVTGEFVGYVAFIEGVDGDIDGDLFNGVPSEDTAYFTFRITKPIPGQIPLPVPDTNAAVTLFTPGGQATFYFNPDPLDRDWNNPATFEQGVPIAVLDESALLNTRAEGAFPFVAFNTFSSRVIETTPIDFNGQRIDFKKLVPNGVTITNFGNGLRFLPDESPGASGGATAIAIGGDLRDK